MLAFDKNTARL